MNSSHPHTDPAFSVMTMDILGDVLSRADDPGKVAVYLTEEIRELIGARCVLVIQCLGTPAMVDHRVLSVNPPRQHGWSQSPAANRLYEIVHLLPEAGIWRGTESSEIAALLRQEGFELSLTVPLNVATIRVGALLALGLPGEDYLDSELNTLNTLSGVVALVLRNALLFERQEQTILERTRALMDALGEQRRAEEEIRKLNMELERRVRERTAQLDASNQELEAFSYSVSHDLRAPLRAINGYARILSEDHTPQLNAEGQRVLGVVHDEALRMGRLIEDLLRFSRLGRQVLRIAPTDMTILVEDVYAQLSARAPGRVVDFRLGPLPVAPADAALLRQVWDNLLDNALKYTRRRERAEITVSGSIQGGEAVYCVRDNGAGFDMKYADKLFGVFQRLHDAEEFEGTGAGLALVQRLVHRHGGRIWAEAEMDRGATFYFSLPVRNEQ